MNEPTAAAFAYGLNKRKESEDRRLRFRRRHVRYFGSRNRLRCGNKEQTVEVRATGGDTHLGGDDFDKKIQEYLVGRI